MEGKITSFQLTKDGAKVSFTDNVIEQGENTVKEHVLKVHRRISDTFRTQLRTLLGHGLLISSIATDKDIDDKSMKNRKIVDMPKYSNYGIIGFKSKKDEDEEEISIIMSIQPELGGEIIVTVPFILLYSEQYPHTELLRQDFEQVLEEVKNYIKGDNYYIQGDLFKSPTEEVEQEDEF